VDTGKAQSRWLRAARAVIQEDMLIETKYV
jgi:hypothetical protein